MDFSAHHVQAGHLGTPGLAMYCSSQWALEGYCDVDGPHLDSIGDRLTRIAESRIRSRSIQYQNDNSPTKPRDQRSYKQNNFGAPTTRLCTRRQSSTSIPRHTKRPPRQTRWYTTRPRRHTRSHITAFNRDGDVDTTLHTHL